MDSRVFWGLWEGWSVPRVIAAVSGTLTLGLEFIFVQRFFQNRLIAFLSVVLLSILPSHVFYSRLALQETLSTLFFLAGFYFYLFPAKLNSRTFLSAVFFIGAYFTNYRLIIIPLLVLWAEIWMSLSLGQRPNVRKYIWHVLTFLSLMFSIGAIDEGQNTVVTFSWMFHQAQLGQHQFDWLNFFSFPYYLFRLEHPFFGLLFFSGAYLLSRRSFYDLLPLGLVLLQMAIFSFAADKAARYVCVVTPFLAASVAVTIARLWDDIKNPRRQVVLGILVFFLVAGMTLKSVRLATAVSDYRPSMQYLVGLDPAVKVISTQPFVQNLYVEPRERVQECPLEFIGLVALYMQGYRYLVLDPQAYITYTADRNKFTPVLKDYLGFILTNAKPVKEFPHFNQDLLERFVFEHNENLQRSLAFLRMNDAGMGRLRIYDINACLLAIQQRLGSR